MCYLPLANILIPLSALSGSVVKRLCGDIRLALGEVGGFQHLSYSHKDRRIRVICVAVMKGFRMQLTRKRRFHREVPFIFLFIKADIDAILLTTLLQLFDELF